LEISITARRSDAKIAERQILTRSDAPEPGGQGVEGQEPLHEKLVGQSAADLVVLGVLWYGHTLLAGPR